MNTRAGNARLDKGTVVVGLYYRWFGGFALELRQRIRGEAMVKLYQMRQLCHETCLFLQYSSHAISCRLSA